jgi:hypothetical protein
MVAGQRRDRRRQERRKGRRAAQRSVTGEEQEEDLDEYDYDDEWINDDDDEGEGGGGEGGQEGGMEEAIRQSLLDLDRMGNSPAEPIAVDDLEDETAKQSRKHRKRIARYGLKLTTRARTTAHAPDTHAPVSVNREEIEISDDEDSSLSRPQKEGRKGNEIYVEEDTSQGDEAGGDGDDELAQAISLSLNTASSTAVGSRPRRGTNERTSGETGGIETRLRSKRQSRQEREQREKELREEEERTRRELLREEQNREFQESLMRDQVIEMAKAQEEQRAREEEAKAREDEERKRAEEEARERNRELMYAELKQRFDEKDKQQQQHGAGEGREVALVLRMANGERLPQRIFYPDELLEEVRQYAILKLLERDRYTTSPHLTLLPFARDAEVLTDLVIFFFFFFTCAGRPSSTSCSCATSRGECCPTSRARSPSAGSNSAPCSASPTPSSSRPRPPPERSFLSLSSTCISVMISRKDQP